MLTDTFRRVASLYLLLTACLISIGGYSQTRYSLKESIDLALLHNASLKSQSYYIDIANTEITNAGLRPNITLNNQTLQLADGSHFENGTHFYNSTNRQIWWQLTKVFQFSGQRKYKIDYSQLQALYISKNYNEVVRNMQFDVANEWLNVWIQKTRYDLLMEAQSNIDTLVDINKLRLKNQVITETDLVRTQLIHDQYLLQLHTTKQEYLNHLNRLKLMMGVSDSMDINVNKSFESIAISPSMDSLVALAMSQRSDISAVKLNIEASKSNIQLQKSLSWPTPELGVIYNPQNNISYVGFFGTVQLPVFNRNQGNIQRSKIQESQARQDLVATQAQIYTEIKTAYQTYHSEQENLENYKKVLQKSTQVLGTVKYAYVKGGTTIIDFLDAQRTWYDVRRMYFEALFNYRRSYIQLLFSSGLINQL